MTNPFRAPHIAMVIAIGVSFVPTAASAQALFFHVDGEPGDRQAYYSQTLVMNRTSPSDALGPIEIKQLDVTVIHENAAKPEWTMLRLQFECPSMYALATGKADKALPKSASVRMRIGEGSVKLRRDLQNEDIPPGSWATTSDPAMLKARKLACHEADINKAMFESYRNQRFDMAAFNAKLKPLGFTDSVMVLAETTGPEQIELTWSRLWRGSKRPDPTGKFSRPATDAERAEAAAKMAVLTKQLDTLTSQIRGKYEQSTKNWLRGSNLTTPLQSCAATASRAGSNRSFSWSGRQSPRRMWSPRWDGRLSRIPETSVFCLTASNRTTAFWLAAPAAQPGSKARTWRATYNSSPSPTKMGCAASPMSGSVSTATRPDGAA